MVASLTRACFGFCTGPECITTQIEKYPRSSIAEFMLQTHTGSVNLQLLYTSSWPSVSRNTSYEVGFHQNKVNFPFLVSEHFSRGLQMPFPRTDAFEIEFDENSFKSSFLGGSPGLVVMGGDSCSKVCWFKSQHCILDGHFLTFICCKNCNVCLKRRR